MADDLLLLFLMGLLGSFHCLGMCGGLVMAIASKLGGGFGFSLRYNSGRLISYAATGALLGLAGGALSTAGLFGSFQGLAPLLAGFVMVAIGVELLGLVPARVRAFFSGVPSLLSGKALSRLLKTRPAPFLAGMFNVLIPCGLLYAAGIKAASTGSPLEGALSMAALGAGTLLPMLFAGTVYGFLKGINARAVTAASALVMIGLGVKAIAYGAGEHMHTLGAVCTAALG